jgi:serine/threonine protein kinase
VCNLIKNKFYLDEVIEELQQNLPSLVLLVRDLSTKNLYVLKMIITSEANRKILEKEVKVGMFVAKECPFLISYSEVFEERGSSCILMDYCEKGDLQKQIDLGNIFEEKV